MSVMLRLVAFLALLLLAACLGEGSGSGSIDAALDPTRGSEAGASTDLTTEQQPTLDTGVNRAVLVAAVTPQVIEFIRSTQPDAAADTVELGRPWGEFDVHKGSRLVFRGSWRLLVAVGGDYVAVAGVVPDGDSYKMTSIGSAQFVPTMVEREQIPAVSAALDRGRAGFLRRITDAGDAYVAYEAETTVDAGQAEIRVQPLALQILDGGVLGVADMSLDELDRLLPAE
jgi:hypothetical protein